MPLCKQCQIEIELSPSDEPICPECGQPFELPDDTAAEIEPGDDVQQTLDFAEIDGNTPTSAEKTANESPVDDGAQQTMEFRDDATEDPSQDGFDFDLNLQEDTDKQPSQDATDGQTVPLAEAPEDSSESTSKPADLNNLAGPGAAVDMTVAFGTPISEDDDNDWDDLDELALGPGDEEDEDATVGPGDMTAPFVEEGTSNSDSDAVHELSQDLSGTAPEKGTETDRMNPDLTVEFTTGDSGAVADSASDTGVDPGAAVGGTLRPGQQPPTDSDNRPGANPSSDKPSSAAASSHFGTLPAGLSGSDRSDLDPPPTANEGGSSRGGESGTLAAVSGSDRRSDRIKTPKPRDVTGLESGQTIPRGPLGEGKPSESLQPGDTHVVGPENVRLRAFRVSGDDQRGPSDFLLDDSVGSGGMGIVSRARQRSLDRDVAVKQVKAATSSNESDRNKFISEAVITGQLEHPNIIPVHDLGLASDGLPFYSMKLVKGQEWEDQIKDLSEEENLNILLQVSQAIAFAHSKDIIHRDLKPGNVMLGGYGEVLVMDWGLAARLDSSDISPSGTPVYMPPETALQYLDYTKGPVGDKKSSTRRVPPGTYSDIYLLGGLLFKIITGRAPHRGKTTFECLKNAARNKIVKTSRRSELLDIAYKALATEPTNRHRDVNEFIEEIKSYKAHAQSNKIARQANQELRSAKKSIEENPQADIKQLYEQYNGARYGFENALELWPGNRRAAKRLVEAKRLHAETAYGHGDYDLALSLLDPEKDDDTELVAQVSKAQSQRERKLALFRTLQYGVASLLVVSLGFIALSVVLGLDAFNQRNIADAAKLEATEQTRIADERKTEASAAKQEASVAIQESALAKSELKQARLDITRAKEDLANALDDTMAAKDAAELAVTAANEAKVKAKIAETARVTAVKQKQEATEDAHFNDIRSKLAESGAYAAWKIFNQAFQPDERQAISQKNSKWMELTQRINWQNEATELLRGLASPVVAIDASGQKLVVATSGEQGTQFAVYLGNDIGRPAVRWNHEGAIDAVALSPDGQLVAVVGEKLALYRTDDGQSLAINGEVSGKITAIAFSPSSDRLLTGDTSTGVATWRLETNTAELLTTSAAWHASALSAVGYSTDGKLLFASDESGAVSFWTNESIDSSPISFRHSDQTTGSPHITAADLAVIDDPETDERLARFAYGCTDGATYVLEFSLQDAQDFSESRFSGRRYNRETATRLQAKPDKLTTPHPEAVQSIAFTEGGRLVVSIGGSKVFVRDASPNDRLGRKPDWQLHDSLVISLALTADGEVVTSDQEGRVIKFSTATPANPARLEPRRGESHGGVATIGVDAEGSSVVVGDQQGFIRTWRDPFASYQYQLQFAGHADHRRMQAWRLPGAKERIVTVGADSFACLWDTERGQLIRTLDLSGRHVVTPAVTGDAVIAATDRRRSGQASAIMTPLEEGRETPLWRNNPRVSALLQFKHPASDEPVLAVGLRDGQFYLWTPSEGRIDLVASSSRPHWRPVQAIVYDRQQNALLVGDSEGQLSRWPLRTNQLASDEPRDTYLPGEQGIRRMELSADGQLLVVRPQRSDVLVQLVDPRTLSVNDAQGLMRAGLQDATFAADGESLLGVASDSRILSWNPQRAGWSPVAAEPSMRRVARGRGAVTGIRGGSDGRVMLFGDGFVHLWSDEGRAAKLIGRADSRALPTTTALSAEGEVIALSNRGRIDTWNPSPDRRREKNLTPEQRQLAGARVGVRACPAAEAGRSFVATPVANQGGATIALTDLASGQSLSKPITIDSGKVLSMQANSDWLAVAVSEPGAHRIELISLTGNERSRIPFDQPPIAISMGPQAKRVAAALATGQVAHASRTATGWSVGELLGVAATAVAFTPAGDQLVVGNANGQVSMLELMNPGEAKITSRVALTFEGHSERVSVLRFDILNGRPTLLSGDAVGSVLVKTL